jgi:hypothetical protein
MFVRRFHSPRVSTNNRSHHPRCANGGSRSNRSDRMPKSFPSRADWRFDAAAEPDVSLLRPYRRLSKAIDKEAPCQSRRLIAPNNFRTYKAIRAPIPCAEFIGRIAAHTLADFFVPRKRQLPDLRVSIQPRVAVDNKSDALRIVRIDSDGVRWRRSVWRRCASMAGQTERHQDNDVHHPSHSCSCHGWNLLDRNPGFT